ncbi:MAG: EAL domain-containing protein [Brevinematia bacterium]
MAHRKPHFVEEYFKIFVFVLLTFFLIVGLHFKSIVDLSREEIESKIKGDQTGKLSGLSDSEIVSSLEKVVRSKGLVLKVVNITGENVTRYYNLMDDSLDKNKIDFNRFHIISFPLQQRFISLFLDKAKFNQKVLFNAVVYLSGFFSLSIILSFLMYFLLKKSYLQPIDTLNIAINRAMNGDYSFRLGVNHSNQKIRSIFLRFNYLLELLELEEDERNTNLYTDSLTQLPNRQKILIDIEQTVTPTLILLNIDFFKEINDCYGNRIGDLTLIAIAKRLKELQKKFYYRLYKMSGDEFAFLFDKQMELEELYTLIKAICTEIEEEPFKLAEHEIFVKVTIGAARSVDIDSLNLKEGKWKSLATHADMALKKAKKLQKHFIIFHESMQISKEFERNLIWKKKLKDAIDSHRLIPFFQPIMNNFTEKVEKYETLIRIADRESGIVTPSYFLDAAKKSHLYGKITSTVLSKAIALFRETDYEFSINLTIQDIIEEEINHFILKTLKENKNVAPKVIFEILESEGIENYDEVIQFIKEVKEIGCKIAIDDFGSGYSNFEHLMKLDVDYIKLDSCLISNLTENYNAQIITKTIVNFAKELGLKTISEFVHSEEIYKKSKELGVDYSQGYFIGKPAQNIIV